MGANKAGLSNSEDDSRPTSKYKRLTEQEWAIVVGLWEMGGIRGKDLADQYGITPESLSRGLSKRRAVYGKNAAAVAKKVVEAAQDDMEITVRRAKETREEHYKIASYLGKLAAGKIQQAEKKEITYSQAEDELRPIMNAMKVNQVARQERWSILGLDRDDSVIADDMPELLIREMTPDEIHDAQAKQEAALREIGALEIAEQDANPEFDQ